MTFLHPILLGAGLACVAIPIIIHFLMRRRRKPRPWAAMRFLMEAYKQRRRRLQFEQWILLALRCLLLALLAFALARPMLGQGVEGGRRAITIVLDDSLTSTANGAYESLREQALDLVDDLNPLRGDTVAFITTAPPTAHVSPPSPDLDGVKRLIERHAPTDARQDVAGALALAEGGEDASIVLLSEFRRGSVALDDALPEQGIPIHASEPASTVVENVAITSFAPLRSLLVGSESGLIATVELERHGSRGAEATTVQFHVESERRESLGTHVVRWADGQAEATLSVTLDALGGIEGDAVVSASIDSDALDADNRMLAPIRVRHAIRCAVVTPRRFEGGGLDDYRPADWIRLALSPEVSGGRAIEVVDLDPAVADLPSLADIDAALVTRPDRVPDWTVYREFVARGGLLVVTPPPDAEVHLWSDEMIETFGLDWTVAREATATETTIRVEDTRRPSVDLFGLIRAEFESLARPVVVLKHVAIEASDNQVQLELEGGEPLLVATHPEGLRGIVAVGATAFDLEWTTLPAKPMMVPLLQELVRQGVGGRPGVTIAGARAEAPPRATSLRSIEQPDLVLPFDARGYTRTPLLRTGAFVATDDAGGTRGMVVVHHDASASDTDIVAPDALRAWLDDASDVNWMGREASSLDARPRPAPGWPLLMAALGLALVELVTARFVSHARRSDGHA